MKINKIKWLTFEEALHRLKDICNYKSGILKHLLLRFSKMFHSSILAELT